MAMKRYNPGDPLHIPAADLNRVADHVEGMEPGMSSPAAGASFSPCAVAVRNMTGGGLLAYTAVLLGAPRIAPSDDVDALRRPVFGATVPAAGQTTGLAILQRNLADGETGPAVVSGASPVRCVVLSASHACAKPDGIGGLVSADSGPVPLFWKEGVGGTRWCFAILGSAASGDTYNGYFKLTAEMSGGQCVIRQSGGWFFINGSYMNLLPGVVGALPFDGKTYHVVLHYHQDLDADGNVTARSYGIENGTLPNPSVMNATATDARWLIGSVTGSSGGAVSIVQQSHGTPYFFTLSQC